MKFVGAKSQPKLTMLMLPPDRPTVEVPENETLMIEEPGVPLRVMVSAARTEETEATARRMQAIE